MDVRQGSAQSGIFYGVGVGPGDPELITLKALRILQQTPVVCVPKSREDGESYALAFLSRLIDLRRQQLLELVFPMTRERAVLEEHWAAALERVLVPLRRGLDVAFVTEGDPLIYSTFIHLYGLMQLRHPDIRIEVVPGVSSINGCAAAAGVPLVDGAERLAVLPAVYESEQLLGTLRQFDTVVLLKVNRAFGRVLESLEELNLASRAVYVSRCGSPEQEVVRDVRTLRDRKLDYLSLVIVRK